MMRALFVFLGIAAAVSAAAPVQAQRVSLADRVTRLEQRMADNQANLELLSQLQDLRAEIQTLRATVEQLQHETAQAKQMSTDQYLDLDARLNRIEGGGATPTAATSTETGSASTAEPAPRVYGDGGGMAATGEEKAAYDLAFEALKAGRYVDSAELFQGFLNLYPSGVYAPNAFYWLGQSFYVTGNYERAEQHFATVVQRYPTHDKASDALLKVGLCQIGKGKTAEAGRTLAQVVTQYPNTDAARIAADRLKSNTSNL